MRSCARTFAAMLLVLLAAMTSSWLSCCSLWCFLPSSSALRPGYAEHVWRCRDEIFEACRGSCDLYSALKDHAFLHGLAATQVPVWFVCVWAPVVSFRFFDMPKFLVLMASRATFVMGILGGVVFEALVVCSRLCSRRRWVARFA